MAIDTIVLLVGAWVGAHLIGAQDALRSYPWSSHAAMSATVAAVGVALHHTLGLYTRNTCLVWRREVTRLVVSIGLLALVTVALGGLSGQAPSARGLGVTVGVWLVGLMVARGFVREWVHALRARGAYAAPVVVVGGSLRGAERAAAFVASNAVLGYEVRGLLAPSATSDQHVSAPYLGPADEVARRAAEVGATGALLDGGSLTGDEVNDLTARLSVAGLHVHVSTGVLGVDQRRVTTTPLADEVLLHVAPEALERRHEVAKRAFDIVLSGVGLVLALPVLAVAAVAIKLEDGGPVLFRQERVGRDGVPFTILKLRTMRPDAEQLLTALIERNEREDGPLFKLSGDPRITRIGRFLRSSSLDELPQLCNVFVGSMSVVGPRPALPSEVADFDEELLQRLRVRPGLTGLWQVEARDVSSFDLYRRYDLMYVNNWTLMGDLELVLRTAASVVVRTLTAPGRPIDTDATPRTPLAAERAAAG